MKTLLDVHNDYLQRYCTQGAATVKFFVEHFDAPKGRQCTMKDLNDFWRLELGLIPFDTFDAREALLDGIPDEDWLRLFKTYVIPVISRLWLPLKLGHRPHETNPYNRRG